MSNKFKKKIRRVLKKVKATGRDDASYMWLLLLNNEIKAVLNRNPTEDELFRWARDKYEEPQ